MVRGDERKSNFKKGVDASDGRRRREETKVLLRKAKKEEQLAKRRAAPTASNTGNNPAVGERVPTLADVPGLLRTMNDSSSSAENRLLAVRDIRRLTSVAASPPAEQLIQLGVLPFMIRFLHHDDEPMLQFEAAWVLTNMASTDFTSAVVEAGALPGAVRLLLSPVGDVREQASWLLGNIAGDCPQLRDLVLQTGAMESLLKNVDNPHSPSLLKNVMWVISNLCRGKPSPDFEIVKNCIPRILYSSQHQYTSVDAQIDSLWALSYLTDGDDERIAAVVNYDIIPFVMRGLLSGNSMAVQPALRVLGNIVTGSAKETQAVIDAGLLNEMLQFLNHAKKSIRKEAAWLLSNIAAGTQAQVDSIIKKTNIATSLVEMSRHAAWEVRRECIHAVSNMLCGGTPKQIAVLVDMDAIESMTDVLDLTDSGLVLVALEAIENVLRAGKQGRKRYDVFFDECDGVSKLELLQHHTNAKVYDACVRIIEEYYGFDEEDVEDENLAPSQNDRYYDFGVPPALATPSKNLFGTNTNMATESPATTFDFGGGFGAPSPSKSNMES